MAYERDRIGTYKPVTAIEWAGYNNTYAKMPPSIKDQLLHLGLADVLEALEDTDNDAIIGLRLGEIASRVLKNQILAAKGLPATYSVTEDEMKLLSLLRSFYERLT